MNKVYSLDTYRAMIDEMGKAKAISNSTIKDQASLDTHFKNIEYIKAQKLIEGEKESIPEDDGLGEWSF